MHFRLQMKHFMLQSLTLKSVISIINKRKRLKKKKTIQLKKDKRQKPQKADYSEWRKKTKTGAKRHQIWDDLQFRCCINHPRVQRSTGLLHAGSFIIPLSQRCQLGFVPRGGINVFLSPLAANYLLTPWEWKLLCQIVTSDVRLCRSAVAGSADQCAVSPLIREEPDSVWLIKFKAAWNHRASLIRRLMNFDDEKIDFSFF